MYWAVDVSDVNTFVSAKDVKQNHPYILNQTKPNQTKAT